MSSSSPCIPIPNTAEALTRCTPWEGALEGKIAEPRLAEHAIEPTPIQGGDAPCCDLCLWRRRHTG